MNHTLKVYRSINDLVYSELPPPDDGDLMPLDQDAIKKENALAFFRYEIVLPQASGAQDHLQTYAATKEKSARDGQQEEKQDDPVWTQIQGEVKNEITQVSYKIQDENTTGISKQEAIDDPLTKISRYTESMARTGVTDQSFLASLFPTSPFEWIAQVGRKTALNIKIGGWIRQRLSPPSTLTADSGKLHQAIGADALYSLLAAEDCREKSHRALLQLLNWGNSPEEKNVFRMFLSCGSGDRWQRATFIFESSDPDSSREPQIDLCSKIGHAQRAQIPLLISFNNGRLWNTSGGRRFLSEFEISPDRVTLETLLTRGDLRTSDLEDSVRKFRFALLLVSSLCSLYFGPWVQHEWSSHSVQIIRNRNGRLVEMLDEAYIPCLLKTEWRQIHTPPISSQGTGNTKDCPRFFLSLAQLLIDIAKGERGHRSSSQDDSYSWYILLADEVRKNINDQLMGDYWSAIQGCLLYLENYDNQSRDSPDEEKDERLRACKVMHEHIIRHLQKNLNFWKEQQKVQSVGGAESGGMTSQPCGHAQRSLGAQRTGNNSSAAALSPPRPRAEARVESKFTLWSDQDDDYRIIEKPTAEPSKFSFISHMNIFRDTYIETLPESTSYGGSPKRVRVAIIDTGLSIEEAELDREGDLFLDHPDVKSRIVERRNFFSSNDTEPNPYDCEDEHGHGTHVARLVLRFAPRADVVVAKICNSKTLKQTKTMQLVNALKWAGDRDGGQADIINISFSLGSMPQPEVAKVIKDLVSNNKLIFAAASNTGGYGSRLWPASSVGVFAIHATNESGKTNTIDTNMNPPPLTGKDNFATFGCDVVSYWKGHYRSISGTSFATPVAAAIGANILEYARRTQPENVANGLTRYGAMRDLFRDRMTPNNVDGHYHCFHPWVEGLWDGGTDPKDIKKIGDVLWEVSVGGISRSHQST